MTASTTILPTFQRLEMIDAMMIMRRRLGTRFAFAHFARRRQRYIRLRAWRLDEPRLLAPRELSDDDGALLAALRFCQ